MTSLGRMMAGGERRYGGALIVKPRVADDFYPTPAECTIALLRAEDAFMPRDVWEPACGNGAMARVLKKSGRSVVATDLVSHGYGEVGRDFMAERVLLGTGIVTNPPFKHAAQFIEKAFNLRARYLALLLKSTFFHAAGRSPLFERHRPARIHALTWRPDFLGGGGPTMECSWFIWDAAARAGATEYRLMRHPTAVHIAEGQGLLFEGAA